MSERAANTPPRSEVLHLPTLFRRVSEGDIRIPGFQRGLVWNREQIRALLDSVYRGYPIGSLLFWTASSGLFKPFVPENVTMPDRPLGTEAQYVLDGMQRLITLYAAFNGGGGRDGRFDLAFDLESRRFVHISRQAGADLAKTQILLKRVFLPRAFIEDQSIIAGLSRADDLLSEAIALHTKFQEYALPVITIVRASADEAVKMFMNINRGGSDLSTVDFMRALTWHNDFDLNEAVLEIREELPEAFYPSDETIAKTIALLLDIDPIPDSILKLQEETVERLEFGIALTKKALGSTAAFLKSTFGIASSEFVPYEGQMLVLAGVFSQDGIDGRTEMVLKKWFLSSSMTEALQGRPDHAIVKLVRDSIRSVRGNKLLMDLSSDIDPAEFSRKQLRKGTAISSGLAALFSLKKVRSVFSGEPIAPADYLESFDASKFLHIVPRHGTSRRLLANLIIISAEEAYKGFGANDARDAIMDCEDEELLSSQLLDKHCVALLRSNAYDEFFGYRSLLIKRILDEVLIN